MNIDPQSIAPAEPDYSARVRWTFVAILFCLSIVSVIDRHILTLLVVPIQARFGLSDVQMSVMIGLAFALPNGLFSIPIGWTVDRYSRRIIIASGLTIWSIATAALCALEAASEAEHNFASLSRNLASISRNLVPFSAI